MASGNDDIVRHGVGASTAATAAPSLADKGENVKHRTNLKPIEPEIITPSSSHISSKRVPEPLVRSRSTSDFHGTQDEDLRRRVALHNLSAKIHRSNFEQEYGLSTPKAKERTENVAPKTSLRRSRSWGDELHIAGTHSAHDSLGMRLASSMHQGLLDEVAKV